MIDLLGNIHVVGIAKGVGALSNADRHNAEHLPVIELALHNREHPLDLFVIGVIGIRIQMALHPQQADVQPVQIHQLRLQVGVGRHVNADGSCVQ